MGINFQLFGLFDCKWEKSRQIAYLFTFLIIAQSTFTSFLWVVENLVKSRNFNDLQKLTENVFNFKDFLWILETSLFMLTGVLFLW